MKRKALPTFSVTGTEWQLYQAEMLLHLLGYDTPDEKWNGKVIKQCIPTSFDTTANGSITYFFSMGGSEIIFRAADLSAIENYVLNYKP